MNIIHNIRQYEEYIPTSLLDIYIRECTRYSDSDTALLRLDSFLSSPEYRELIADLDSETTLVLARTLALSPALSGRLLSSTEIIAVLRKLDNPLESQDIAAFYAERFGNALQKSPILSEQTRAIHIEHTIQLMRLCARNADPANGIEIINRELAALADATIDTALSLSCAHVTQRIGEDLPEHRLTVIGLGKLGGRELNVSSDIDLIYLIDNEPVHYAHYDSDSYHRMLAERLGRILSEATELGFLYRVDTRLRADGSSGPLVRTVGDYIRYLEMRGEPWERQMLIKARPVAGRYKTAEEFLHTIERFIYPESISRSPNREIVELKNRIEERLVAEGSKKTHLKLRPGGIRDIEFITQCLQLLMGGRRPEVRCSGTLDSLEALHYANALSKDEYSTLAGSYKLYRKIENALQWQDLLPAFNLSDNQDDLSSLSKRLGYNHKKDGGAQELYEDIQTALKSVREIYTAVFALNSEDSFDEMTIHAARYPAGDDRVRRFLESLGFGEPEQAARALTRLVFGEHDPLGDVAIHDSARRFVPILLKRISEEPDPVGTLDRMSSIAIAYGARHVLFDALDSREHFFSLLLAVASGSVFLTNCIIQDPSLLDWLVESGEIGQSLDEKDLKKELKSIEKKAADNETFTKACLLLRNREQLRAGVRQLVDLADTNETFHALTRIAAAITESAYRYATGELKTKRGLPSGFEFCVLAAGRMGANMMDFGSDLDLIFVFRHSGIESEALLAQQRAIELSHLMLKLISGSGVDRVYEVDARLRPEGGNALIAVSIDEYRRYFQHRASPWERLALTRSMTTVGCKKLMAATDEAVDEFVYSRKFTKDEIAKIIDIRRIMTGQSQKRHPGHINVKSGPGGIADIDFLAQTYTAHFGVSLPEVRMKSTAAMLSALAKEGSLDSHDVKTLLDMYEFLCDVESALRIGSGRSINTFSESDRESYRIARLLGFRNVRRFKKRLKEVTGRIHELYVVMMENLFNQIRDGERQS